MGRSYESIPIRVQYKPAPSASPIAFFPASPLRPLPVRRRFAGPTSSTFAGFLPDLYATEGCWYESIPTRVRCLYEPSASPPSRVFSGRAGGCENHENGATRNLIMRFQSRKARSIRHIHTPRATTTTPRAPSSPKCVTANNVRSWPIITMTTVGLHPRHQGHNASGRSGKRPSQDYF